jgi:hypothetical protein
MSQLHILTQDLMDLSSVTTQSTLGERICCMTLKLLQDVQAFPLLRAEVDVLRNLCIQKLRLTRERKFANSDRNALKKTLRIPKKKTMPEQKEDALVNKVSWESLSVLVTDVVPKLVRSGMNALKAHDISRLRRRCLRPRGMPGCTHP